MEASPEEVRTCEGPCGRTLTLNEENFAIAGRRDGRTWLTRKCRGCVRAYRRDYERRIREEDPERWKDMRERNRAANLRQPKPHRAALQRKYRARRKVRWKANPAEHAAFLADRRIDWQLWREKRGAPACPARRQFDAVTEEGRPVLDGAPFRVWLEGVIRAEPPTEEGGRSLEVLADAMGLHPRALSRLRTAEDGPSVELDTVDRAFTRLQVDADERGWLEEVPGPHLLRRYYPGLYEFREQRRPQKELIEAVRERLTEAPATVSDVAEDLMETRERVALIFNLRLKPELMKVGVEHVGRRTRFVYGLIDAGSVRPQG